MTYKNKLTDILDKNNKNFLKEYFFVIINQDQKFFLRNDIIILFNHYCDLHKKTKKFRQESLLFKFLKRVQELFIYEEYIVIMHRYDIAKYSFYLARKDGESMEEINCEQYLFFKDRHAIMDNNVLTDLNIDFLPFYDYAPSIKEPRNIGNGIRFLNRYLCSQIFSDPKKWNTKLFEFIKLHKYNGQQILVNGNLIKDFNTFFDLLQSMVNWLKTKNVETPFTDVEIKMRKKGFEPGWGNNVGIIIETMQILIDLINEPDAMLLGKFISRVPMPLVSKIAIISPHGWFGQTNVLGKPDTGGQVVYILDQVRALEKHLKKEVALSGLDIKPHIIVVTRLLPEAENTTCNQRLEKIFNTDNCWILRIPFRDSNQNIVKKWISRFKIWPYLENYAEDVSKEISSMFVGRPDLIIGNYSDGNLVATLLSDKLDVIQCNIAHALEKTKYLFSDLYWQDHEEKYNFSLQFTADMLAMNKADFIITSTFQEIIGTEDTMGQYESYQFFTLPKLYKVINGINLYAPKFNVIRPGVEENLYFPYFCKEKRVKEIEEKWEKRLFHDNSTDIYGELTEPEKIPIFTMARLDKIKNITGLIEAFGMSKKLQKHCNLIFAAGSINIDESEDIEEREEISKAYELIDHYQLYDRIRWLPSINKLDTGMVYRIIADRKGFFVQPALFEAFGLTIIEAMASGLPTFATKFGGPVEIIEDQISGFLLNTSKPALIADSLEEFIEKCEKDQSYWQKISENGIKRVSEHFTWKLYSDTLIFLTKLYGFWRYSVAGKGKVKLDRYCDMIYHFLLKQRADKQNTI